MKLQDLDKEYRKLSDKTAQEKLDYCEKLVIQMRNRLSDDYSDTNHIRALILEMIEAAEDEIDTIKKEMKKKK